MSTDMNFPEKISLQGNAIATTPELLNLIGWAIEEGFERQWPESIPVEEIDPGGSHLLCIRQDLMPGYAPSSDNPVAGDIAGLGNLTMMSPLPCLIYVKMRDRPSPDSGQVMLDVPVLAYMKLEPIDFRGKRITYDGESQRG